MVLGEPVNGRGKTGLLDVLEKASSFTGTVVSSFGGVSIVVLILGIVLAG